MDTGLAANLTRRDRAETVAERERLEADPATVEPVRWARTSFTATLSLIIGVSATLAALSGRLAPLAVAVGVVGLVFAALGLTAVSRRHVTGHHVALLGLAFSIAGVVFGVLAINRSLPWLDGGADQATQLRDWLNSHWSWLSRW
jgi:beta-phosphoglucomutase-like phosphatase (HAD superfamily)